MQAENSKKSLFAERLDSMMREKGFNQVSLSEMTGVNQSGISKYVRGDSTPRAGELARMAIVLNVTMDWLWGIDENIVKNDWKTKYEQEKKRADKAETELKNLKDALKTLVNTING